jgi:hypothetical protein
MRIQYTLHISKCNLFVTPVPEEEKKKMYVCPPDFAPNGNSCYCFSTHMATWEEAHWASKDRDNELARLENGWEDQHELQPQ